MTSRFGKATSRGTRANQELVQLAQSGNREAREALFNEAFPDLLQAARFRLGPALRKRMDTMDLVQTVYVEAVKDLSRYRYEGKGSFSRWLLGILENKIRKRAQFFRAKRRDIGREVPLETTALVLFPSKSASRKLSDLENKARLEAAMDKLPEDYRELIVCRYYLGMSWAEVGGQLGKTEEASQMACRRALARLKSLYGKED